MSVCFPFLLKRSLKHVYALHSACSNADTKQVLLRRAEALIEERRPFTWHAQKKHGLTVKQSIEMDREIERLLDNLMIERSDGSLVRYREW